MSIDSETAEPSVLSDLSAAKRRLLAQRLSGSSNPRKRTEKIQPRPAADRTPISPDQYRVWLHASMQPDLPNYNEPITIEHRGSLALNLLEASFNRFLQRHEAWRTSFVIEHEEVLQVVHPELHVKLEMIDLSELPESECAAEAQRLTTQQALQPLRLTDAPLFRVLVLRLAADRHRLHLVLHHIIFDGISIRRTFIPELAAIYAALEAGVEPSLPEQRLQYCDYAAWRQQQLASGLMKSHVDYWRTVLAGELPVLRLPTGRPRPSIISHRGGTECFIIPRELTVALRELGQARGATLYMTLLAVFKVLLFRYSGQQDIIVGGAADARRLPELQGMMGYILDTFAVRSHPTPDLAFSAYLTQVKDAVLWALDAADVPFERVVQSIGVKPDLSHHPVFQNFFSLLPNVGEFPAGWDMPPMEVNVGAAKFDIYLEVDERPSHSAVRIVYSTDLFEADTIRRMAGHWLALLEAVCENPDCPLSDLRVLTPEEQETILGKWNATEAEFPRELVVHELFEEQARQTPETTAVLFEDASLSYAELNLRANRLAHYLRELGVGPDARVAICADRSLEMVVALLAILKAGGAYVPLDPSHPAERLGYMLEDSAPVVLLTQGDLIEIFSGLATNLPVIDLAATSSWGDQPATNPDRASLDLTPEHLAYVIYTSGSTGQPKGVMVKHGGVVNRLVWMQRAYRLSPADAVLQKTPFSFDVSVWEFFWTLSTGARLVIARPEGHKNPAYLWDAIRRNRITTAHFVPSMLQVFLEQAQTPESSTLMRVFSSGEALSAALVRRFQERLPGSVLYNLYGPTEATVDATAWTCPANMPGEVVPIGRPIANTRIYILDANRRPVPMGVAGELYIGGVQVARGYLNRPALTAERFLADPFASQAGARMYRTGDLGRWLPDGNIDYLGRNDFQVKVRGFRIELGEIEARLTKHPGVGDAVVIAREDTPGDTRLVAYYTSAANEAESGDLGAEALRSHISSTLPEYMVPAAYVRLDSLPLTSNGKLDRKALPPPTPSSLQKGFDPPVTEGEKRLAKIWAETLGIDHVSRGDNFVGLGGHSLLLVRLFARINKEFKSDLPITTIFDAQTLSALAKVLQDKVRISSLVPVQISGTKPPLFVAHSYLLYHALSGALGIDQPFYGLRELPDDENESIEERALRYVADMRRVQPNGPYRIAAWCAGGALAAEIARQVILAGEEVALLALFDSWLPGYKESLKSNRRAKSYPRALIDKWAHHKTKLADLSVAARARYFWGVFRRISRDARDEIYIQQWNNINRFYKWLSIPLPQFMCNATPQFFWAIQQFRVEPIPVRLTLIRASETGHIANASESLGWEKIADFGVDVLWAPGDHETMFQGNNLKITAELVGGMIDSTASA